MPAEYGDRRSEPPVFLTGGDPEHLACVRLIVTARERIRQAFDATLFGDPAFDILLYLFRAGHDGTRVALTRLAEVAHVPQTTGLRYVMLLERQGIVERYPHPHDRRIVLIRLTKGAAGTMAGYLAGVAAAARGG